MTEYKTFSLRLNAQSPLALGNESNLGNFERTISYVPGAVTRGAIATKALNGCQKKEFISNHASCPLRAECPFWVLFGQDNIFFGNAYPGTAGPVYPFPLTARTCKYYPGLHQEDKILDEFHDVYDVLAERFVFEILSDVNFPLRSVLLPGLKDVPRLQKPFQEKCPQCGEPVERAEGYYIPGPSLVAGSEPFIRRAAHVGINRSRSVAEDSLLFSQETMDTHGTQIQFFGRVTVPTDQADLLRKTMEGKHFIGRGRSRGFGQVDIGVTPAQAQNTLLARKRDFQAALNVVLSKYRDTDHTIPAQFSGTLISLTAQSPIILEGFGRPYLIPTANDIQHPEAQLVRAWTRPVTISGWNTAGGLPRRTRLAASAGSVFLYYIPSEKVSDTKLEELELNGLGAERIRGMGQVEVCSSFHIHTSKSGGKS